MPTILFGSISTLADTSELQRDAFNRAFAQHGLDWHWDRDDYRSRLGQAGGKARIARYAADRGEDVDADAVHETKSKLFQESLTTTPPGPRPGVLDVVAAADRLGLVTTTAPENVTALLSALGPDLRDGAFDVVVDATRVSDPKPDPAAYAFALRTLGADAASCVAVEDNPDGVRAAVAAGLTCVAFPNENTAGADFPGAAQVVDALDPEALRRLAS